MKCNIRQHKPLTPYQQKKWEAEVALATFEKVLGLTAYALECLGADKLQIQKVINKTFEQYDCLSAGTLAMNDIHSYLKGYGVSFDKSTIRSDITEYDEELEDLKLEEQDVIN